VLERIARQSRQTFIDAGWPPIYVANVGNDDNSVVVWALEAYAKLDRPVPHTPMIDIMTYLNGYPDDQELWSRSLQTGLIKDARSVVVD